MFPIADGVQSYHSSHVYGPTKPDYAIVATFRHRPKYIGLIIELKWLQALNPALLSPNSALQHTAAYITPDGRNTQLSHEALRHVWSEALYQTMWNVYTGYILSRTVHGVAWFNEFFVRVAWIPGDTTGEGTMAVEIDEAVGSDALYPPSARSANTPTRAPDAQLKEQGGELDDLPTRARPAIEFEAFCNLKTTEALWAHPPNSVATTFKGKRCVSFEGVDRLSAMIMLGLYLAGIAQDEPVDDSDAPSTDKSMGSHVDRNPAVAANIGEGNPRTKFPDACVSSRRRERDSDEGDWSSVPPARRRRNARDTNPASTSPSRRVGPSHPTSGGSTHQASGQSSPQDSDTTCPQIPCRRRWPGTGRVLYGTAAGDGHSGAASGSYFPYTSSSPQGDGRIDQAYAQWLGQSAKPGST